MNKIKYMLGFVVLAGCSSDPFVGNWEGELDSKVDLVINNESGNEYSGQGHVYMYDVLCPFEVDGKGYDKNLTLDFQFYKTNSTTCVNGSVNNIECVILDDNSRLKCEVPGGTTLVYNKSE